MAIKKLLSADNAIKKTVSSAISCHFVTKIMPRVTYLFLSKVISEQGDSTWQTFLENVADSDTFACWQFTA